MIMVRVPATSANIGPGFDCLGMALNLYNTFCFQEIDEGLEIEGCDPEFANEDNLIYKAMNKTFNKLGYNPSGIRIKIENDIPISRGLGSSAACIIGGIIGANEIAGKILDNGEIINIATEMEGHPDNVVPALTGGITISVMDNNKVYSSKINNQGDLKLCALIPNFKLSTEKARGILPTTIPFKDGVYNISRTALLVSSLANGDLENLGVACMDKLHQDYRGKLIRNYDSIVQKCNHLDCICTFLSGAGPTIMVIVKDEDIFKRNIEDFLNTLEDEWHVESMVINKDGAIVERL